MDISSLEIMCQGQCLLFFRSLESAQNRPRMAPGSPRGLLGFLQEVKEEFSCLSWFWGGSGWIWRVPGGSAMFLGGSCGGLVSFWAGSGGAPSLSTFQRPPLPPPASPDDPTPEPTP